MKNKTKTICFLLTVLCLIFASCSDGKDIYIPGDPGNYQNPNTSGDPNNPNNTDNPGLNVNPYEGQSADITFSHNSGRYDSQFSLTLTAAQGKTIYYSTDGSIPSEEKVGNGFVFEYTGPISISNRNSPVQPNVLAKWVNHIRMFMNVSDITRQPHSDPPGKDNTFPRSLSDNQVPKATVIRAVAVENGSKSEVLTRTYFVGSSTALFGNTNVRVISLVAEPDDLVSDAKGIMVTGGDTKVWDDVPSNIYNYRQRGNDWERAASFELFHTDTNKAPLLSTNVGIRIRGGWSRGHGQKSFNVYFRSNSDLNGLTPAGVHLSGINNFVRNQRGFELIPGAVKANGTTSVDTTKSFMLRSGGNDAEYTKLYDVFIHRLLKNRKMTTQAAVPVIVYINGEYWGPYNMQERYSDNFYEYKYGVPRNEVISIDNWELDDGNPGEEQLYFTMIDDFLNTGDYAQFCQRMDIDSFVDYWAAQIYINNEDWPGNNFILWRTRTNVPGNTYGDTKWRYSLHDTEFSMGIYNGGNIEDSIARVKYGGDYHNNLFKKLLENNDFRTKFNNTMQQLMNNNFSYSNYNPVLNELVGIYRPLMGNSSIIPSYYTRWNNDGWDAFDYKINDARKYLNDIRTAMPVFLQDKPALQGETFVSYHSAYSSNTNPKFEKFTSASSYEIVNIPGRGNVMKVSYPRDWATVLYNIPFSSGQKVNITFSADVRVEGEPLYIIWQVNNETSDPLIPNYPVLDGKQVEDSWVTMRATNYEVTLKRDDTNTNQFYLSNWNDPAQTNNLGVNSIFYIDNISINVTLIP